jgi:hypothetical protein
LLEKNDYEDVKGIFILLLEINMEEFDDILLNNV